MTSVPYLYINLIALSCYIIMLAAFLAANKTAENKAFIYVLTSLIIWTAGSTLMRLRIPPDYTFWFYVSLLGLFATPLLVYLFVCSFANVKNRVLTTIWSVGTVTILLCTPFGLFLLPPDISGSGTDIYFTYAMDWPIYIPCAFFIAIILSVIRIFIGLIRQKGEHIPGLTALVAGCLIVAMGNMLQIMPGNTFPFDMFAGICFAVCLMYALIRKRVFRLEALGSTIVIQVASILLCMLLAFYFITPLERLANIQLGLGRNAATLLICAIFILCYVAINALLRKFFATIFTQSERLNQAIYEFSNGLSRTLDVKEVTDDLRKIVRETIHVRDVHIFLEDGDSFSDGGTRKLSQESGCYQYFKNGYTYFSFDSYKHSNYFKNAPAGEQRMLRELPADCAVALRADNRVVGILLTAAKREDKEPSSAEIEFLTTVCAMASLAIKNALLYEELFREARMDNLTNTFSYSYFVEKLNEDFASCGCLSLLFLDVDDMKLYNQLHGTMIGDQVLIDIAATILDIVGDKGTVFRYSGKTFAILLPYYTDSTAYQIAEHIQERVYGTQAENHNANIKTITLSAGICASPAAASTAQDLSEHADLALFNAKNSGKGVIKVFNHIPDKSKAIAERVRHIIELSESKDNSQYAVYSPTILALTATIDAKDHYTYTHSQNVAYYASTLAVAAGLNDDQVRLVYEAALLHDIGKISIPETILGKTGPLTFEERQVMNKHVDNAIEIIRHLPFMDYVIPTAVAHHERWDGGGYPRGIAREEIPITGRCLAIADVFDAITSDRPYRSKRSVHIAIGELEMNRGKQFDPHLVDIFLELIRRGEISVAAAGHDAV